MITRVRIAEFLLQRESGLLVTVGLGSCVGVVIYDPLKKIGGMAHILLADSTQASSSSKNLMKYADTAIPLMLDKMLREGALPKRLTAKIAGGGQLFSYNIISGISDFSVGDKNIVAVKKTLTKLGVPLLGEDVGGSHGRTMKFYLDTGKVEVTSMKGYKKIL